MSLIIQEAEAGTKKLISSLSSLETQLRSRTFVAGHAISLADIMLCCDLQAAFEKV